MKILGFNIGKKINKASISGISPKDDFNSQTGSDYFYAGGSRYPIISESFDGEKTPGEMGAPRNLIPNHRLLSARVFEAQLKSDVVKIITGKFFKWVVGNGLKLQAEPKETVLETEGISIPDIDKFRKDVESRFSVYTSSKVGDYKEMTSLHNIAAEAYKEAFLGGDCLCVLRVNSKKIVSAQIIEGRSIKTPILMPNEMRAIERRGNLIRNGVEINKKGRHIAFYVLTDDGSLLGKYVRIRARGSKTGRVLAWLVYGSKHRINDVRGIPVITQILEKVEKFDRYTEATVGSAEERAKIVFSVEHTRDSDGENPMIGKARQAAGISSNSACETSGYDLGEKTAATVAATTGKQTFNMPIGSKLVSLSSQNEIQYGPFSKAIFGYMCASVDIPPEVAMQLYEQNYSSSRAAINSWDYIVKVYRKVFSDSFYGPIYNLWFELEVLKNKVSAPGFIQALKDDNFMVIGAYLNSRFIGTNMPHIDPLKEVKAVRSMLGNDADPLISREQATEILGNGDWNKNIEQYKTEQDALPEPEEPEVVEDKKEVDEIQLKKVENGQ